MFRCSSETSGSLDNSPDARAVDLDEQASKPRGPQSFLQGITVSTGTHRARLDSELLLHQHRPWLQIVETKTN
jgi:hypothetical protein